MALPTGERVPALGMGAWNLGDHRAMRERELAALRLGIELGARLIDTAEMYGDGRSERLVGEAIAGQRDQVFLVSKVLPHRATREGVVAACEASLERLATDRIDLYLLHWRGRVPLHETVAGFMQLQRAGKIRHWGVSNFDLDDMRELLAVEGGTSVACNQVLYNLSRRGPEWELGPWLRERNIALMAYSPIEQARLLRNSKLAQFAAANGMSAAQVALAWLLRSDGVIAIPCTSQPERMRENVGACDKTLDPRQLAALDQLFPPPRGPRPLEMI